MLWHELAATTWRDRGQPFPQALNLNWVRLKQRKLNPAYSNSLKVKAEFKMNLARSLTPALWMALAFSPWSARAQSCQTSGDLDDATRNAIAAAGQRYF